MKLNYTSLQHPVEPVEVAARRGAPAVGARAAGARPPLHGHLAPAAWAAAQARPGLRRRLRADARAGRCPGSLSRDVAELRERGLLCGHVTAGPGVRRRARGDQPGRRARRRGAAGWAGRRSSSGPGPGILGSATRLGHGGMAALDNAHAALALGLPTLLSPAACRAPTRAPRHRGLSHHTATVLELLLAPVRVPVPEIELEGWPTGDEGAGEVDLPSVARRPARGLRRPPRRRRRAGRPRGLRGAAGCRRGRWAGRSPRTRCSSPPPLAAGRALAGAVGGEG